MGERESRRLRTHGRYLPLLRGEKNERDEIGASKNAWQMAVGGCCPPGEWNKTQARSATRFVSIVLRCHSKVARVQSSAELVSGRHQMTRDKATTNWYHPTACASRKMRGPILYYTFAIHCTIKSQRALPSFRRYVFSWKIGESFASFRASLNCAQEPKLVPYVFYLGEVRIKKCVYSYVMTRISQWLMGKFISVGVWTGAI